MGSDKPATRRRYSAEVKAQVMAECDAPGASVAKVAMEHGINANVVHRWRQLARETPPQASEPYESASQFIPVTIAEQTPAATLKDIQIQLRRGQTTLTIAWPSSAAAECAAWVRELLR